MQNNTNGLECLNCWYVNDFNAENCARCVAILQFKTRPAPHRDRLAVNIEAEKPKSGQTFKLAVCVLLVLAALGIIAYEIAKPKEPVKAVRPQQVIVTSDEDPEMPAHVPINRTTAEEIGTRPLETEKEKEAVTKEFRAHGGDEGCSTQFTVNRLGQRVPMPPSPDKPLTIHGITVGVYYEKVENYALAEASFDIDRTCGDNSRGTFTIRRQYVWKTLGSGFFYWEHQPDGFNQQITNLVRKQREAALAKSENVNQAVRQAESGN